METSATRPGRKRLFGPLLYSTLVLGALACLFSAFEVIRPRVESWLELRSLGRLIRSPDSQQREQALAGLVLKGPPAAVPYLLGQVVEDNPAVLGEPWK